MHTVSVTIVIYDWSYESANPDLTILSYSFHLSIHQTTWVNDYAGRPTNFGISNEFTASDGFDGNCLVGMY
jgi:hypothetical protein